MQRKRSINLGAPTGSEEPPRKKKKRNNNSKANKAASYEYLSKLNEKIHPRTELWMPKKPDFAALAEEYEDFRNMLYSFFQYLCFASVY